MREDERPSGRRLRFARRSLLCTSLRRAIQTRLVTHFRQATIATRDLRLRIATPISPKPAISIAHSPGSGTADAT